MLNLFRYRMLVIQDELASVRLTSVVLFAIVGLPVFLYLALVASSGSGSFFSSLVTLR